VNIRYQRHVDLLLNQFKGFRRVHGRHRDAHDIHTHTLQRTNLVNRGFHVGGAGISHGLNGDGSTIADWHLADVNTR